MQRRGRNWKSHAPKTPAFLVLSLLRPRDLETIQMGEDFTHCGSQASPGKSITASVPSPKNSAEVLRSVELPRVRSPVGPSPSNTKRNETRGRVKVTLQGVGHSFRAAAPS